MQENLINQVMAEVTRRIQESNKTSDDTAKNAPNAQAALAMPEFVGTAIGHTIGLVIPNVDSSLHSFMKLDKRYRALGILGARTGAGPQILAADEAVKACNVDVLSIELPRDTEGGAGHGSLIIFGSDDVADAHRAVEVALAEIDRTMGDVYGNEAGHLEFQYTARASHACNKAFNAPINKAFGLIVGGPAAIGVVMADTAIKAAQVDVVGYGSPGNGGTSFSNEAILMISGDSGAVRQAVISAREVGLKLLGAMGSEPKSTTTPYI
ncbi:propanediol utilization microcompartment protein PduB [Neisseria sp. Ec49-e6-T10]|uniref:propanediol utilization microcompartment protein PduB n=1 Tax=Neisseria sp. Ec49-e6-T10 TaxID=3140744 RepID=UPI003EBD05E1